MNTLAELQHITKRYGPEGAPFGQPVLDGISLTISEGDTIAVTGPSGSGKSTLLNIIGTLDTATNGDVILNGVHTTAAGETVLAELRNRFIGFVFQLHHLLPQLTLSENILLPTLPLRSPQSRREAAGRALYLAERVGISHLLNSHPTRLSIGECQRAALVRALVNSPKLVLADEPTGSLDEENALRIGRLLEEISREEQVAVVVVTHSDLLAARMKTRYRLTMGKLQLQGQP